MILVSIHPKTYNIYPEFNAPTANEKQMPQDLELLAPAGDWAALEAALDAGADAVYFGLRTLNARRRAKNFSPREFVKAVETVHARGAKAYLTLNIDLAERELGQAARILELARQCRADAVLVRDPALLALRPEYPEIEFHFSTQTCMANSADVAAAAALGRRPRGPGPRNDPRRNRRRIGGARRKNRGLRARRTLLFGFRPLPVVELGRRPQRQPRRLHQPLPRALEHKVEKVSGTFCRNGPEGAEHKMFLTPFPSDTPLSMKDLSLINRLPELRQAGVAG